MCKCLFSKPKEISYEKFFGLYLHSLVVHAPRQYEIVCLKSVNTENQERIFQQAKQIALKCTNRKPENVIPSVLIRLQAKEITEKLSNIYHSAITRVENVSNKTAFTGTVISKCFIESRSHSWQAHLSRISAYLVSKNVWWKATHNSLVFFDGDKDLECRVEGPSLNHYRSCSIEDIEKQSVKNWKHILENEIELPTLNSFVGEEVSTLHWNLSRYGLVCCEMMVLFDFWYFVEVGSKVCAPVIC